MRSDLMKSGVERIAHRALFRALGLTQEEIDCVYGQNFLRFLHG